MKYTIYIRRSGALGDVILTQPILEYFLNEGNQVIFVSRFAEIFKPMPGLTLRLNFGRFDQWRYQFQRLFFKSRVRWIELDGAYENNPHLSIREAYRRAAGIKEELGKVNGDAFVKDLDCKLPNQLYVLFHLQAPSCQLNYRSIHGVDWVKVAQVLTQKGYSCIELMESDAHRTPILPLFIEHNIAQLFQLMPSAVAFVGLDSAPAHIAVTSGVPAFIFFGSVNPALRLDMRTFKGHIFQNSCEFAGCYHTAKGTRGVSCRVVGDEGLPPCCTFETEEVIQDLVRFLSAYQA
jgi:ADP-heptose:LPS heptosyltransferase